MRETGTLSGPGLGAGAAPRRARRPLRPLLRAGAILLLAAGGGFLWFVLRAVAPVAEGPSVPGIAVLTGGPDRVEAGLLLLTARPAARLIVSGVGPDAELPDLLRATAAEPEVLSGRLVLSDVAPDRITLGHGATSTRGNAREVAAWAHRTGIREITVVTAGFHMPRALLELRRDLPDAALHPHPVAPHLARPVPMLREYVKLLGAALNLSALTERTAAGRPPVSGTADKTGNAAR